MTIRQRCFKWLSLGLAYFLLALVITWPAIINIWEVVPGYPTVDALDTIHLRAAFAAWLTSGSSETAFWPTGFDVLALTPNVVDHLLAAPLVLLLPFPMSDGVWWILALTANGLAAHAFGEEVGGGAGGFFAGVAFACSDTVLREANLHHAPQALALFLPLTLLYVHRALEQTSWRAGLMAGIFFALAALTYWYNGLFLALGLIPLVGARWREARPLLVSLLVAAMILAIPAWITLSSGAGILDAALPAHDLPGFEHVQADLRFVASHGADPLFPFRRAPMDLSNRVSLVLLAAAAWGLWRARGRGRELLPWLGMAAVGYVFVLGPYLLWDRAAVPGPVPLPFRLLGTLHPILGRLHWPERWGVLLPLGLIPLVVRLPRPTLLAALLLVESLLLSRNLPLQVTELARLEGWRTLDVATGAILELPLRRRGLDAALPGLHQRYHRRPCVNPMLMPPGERAPAQWKRYLDQEPLISWIRRFEDGFIGPPPEGAVDAAVAAGISALALDAEPGGALTRGGVKRYQYYLPRYLGEPVDYGITIVWWLEPVSAPQGIEDPERWRESVSPRRLKLDTMIQPFYSFRRDIR